MISKGTYNKYNIYDLSHSHTEKYASYPSGLKEEEKGGDVKFARYVRKKLNEAPKQDYSFRIYLSPEKYYFNYSENSKYEDFFEKDGSRLQH